MTDYIVRELQNVQSYRSGERIEANSLTEAKRKASNMKVFRGTVLVIEDKNGNRISVKKNGRWHNKKNKW